MADQSRSSSVSSWNSNKSHPDGADHAGASSETVIVSLEHSGCRIDVKDSLGLSRGREAFLQAARKEFDPKNTKRLQTTAAGILKYRFPFVVVSADTHASATTQMNDIKIATRSGHIEQVAEGIFLVYCSYKKAKRLARNPMQYSWVGLLDRQSKKPANYHSKKHDLEEVTIVAHLCRHRHERSGPQCCVEIARLLYKQKNVEACVVCQSETSVAVSCDGKSCDDVLDFLASIPRVFRTQVFAQPKFFDGAKKKFTAGIPPGQTVVPQMMSDIAL
eukprot:ANDGO_02877.mRNA.1 hypothetical protein